MDLKKGEFVFWYCFFLEKDKCFLMVSGYFEDYSMFLKKWINRKKCMFWFSCFWYFNVGEFLVKSLIFGYFGDF